MYNNNTPYIHINTQKKTIWLLISQKIVVLQFLMQL